MFTIEFSKRVGGHKYNRMLVIAETEKIKKKQKKIIKQVKRSCNRYGIPIAPIFHL